MTKARGIHAEILMTGRTHLAAGLIAGEALAVFMFGTEVLPSVAVIAASAVGSLLPDIDHPGSRISKKTMVGAAVSRSVSAVTRHRGFTHTLVFAAMSAIITFFVCTKLAAGYAFPVTIGLVAGILSHLFLDTLNPGGIMWLWPIYPRHIHILKIRTGSQPEFLFMYALQALATAGIVWIGYSQPQIQQAVGMIKQYI